jgi:LysM repeat protein
MYEFYLIDEAADETIQLPVPPADLKIRHEKLSETVEFINVGEVEFTSGKKIRSISFSSFWPREFDASYCQSQDIPDPSEISAKIDEWVDQGKPIRLIIADTEINQLMTVVEYEHGVRGGEEDRHYSMTLHTYVEVKVRTADETTAASKEQTPERPDTKPIPAEYQVKTDDSLYDIAKANYGDGERWQDIYNLNKKAIGDDPNVIQPGTKLVMP